MANRSQFSYRRHLYRWVYDGPDETMRGKVIAFGFTSQKKAMDWLKQNNLKGLDCHLEGYTTN